MERLGDYVQTAAFETGEAPLILLDRSLRGVAANPAFCRYFALSCDQIVGVEFPHIVNSDLFADTVAPLLNRGLAGVESAAELLLSAADDAPRTVMIKCLPLIQSAGLVDMLLVSLHWHSEAPFVDMLLRLDELIFTGADVLEIVRVAARQISQLTNNGQVRVNLTLPDLIAYLGWDSDLGPVTISVPKAETSIGEGVVVDRHTLTREGLTFGEITIVPAPNTRWPERQWAMLEKIVERLQWAIYGWLQREEYRRSGTELEVIKTKRSSEIARRLQISEGRQHVIASLRANRSLDTTLKFVAEQAKALLGATDIVVYYPVDLDEPEIGTANLIFPLGRPVYLSALVLDALVPSVAEAVETRQPILIRPQGAGNSGRSALQAEADDGNQTFLIVAIQVEAERASAVIYCFPKEFELSPETLEHAVGLAEQVLLAMEGSRLQRRAQDAAALEERERLARELHDAVTQSVYSLSLFAEAGRRVASLGQMERVQEYLTMLGDTTVQAMKEMRLLLYELRPAMLEQVGLIGALGQRLEAVERRANLRAHLEVNGIDRLPPEIEEGLYRIAQEALNNALKHSSAKTITVRLSRVDGQPVLEIADDGIGFELAPDGSAEGEGLMNIRELAALLNAKLQIESAPRQGTWLRVTVMQPERDDVDINGKEPIR